MADLVISLPSTASEWVALVGGVIGGVLGIRSEVRAWRAERPRLKVIPVVGFAAPVNGVPSVMLGVEVINTGRITVTIDEVGFHTRPRDSRCAILSPISTKLIRLPYALEPHTSQSFFADPKRLPEGMLADVKNAYAKTATDHCFSGTSKALRKVIAAGRLPRSAPVLLPMGGLSTSRHLAEWKPELDQHG